MVDFINGYILSVSLSQDAILQHEGLDRKIKEIRLQMVICSLSCYFSGVYL